AIFLPSGLNMGNASKPLSRLILVKPDPSSFTVYILKGNPLGYSWLDAKIILLLSGINEGAQFAWPNRVTCFAFLPSISATKTSIFVGATKPSASKDLYSVISASVFGRDARQMIFVPSGLNQAPPS